MGSIFDKTCCVDKGALITSENITSRMTSPCHIYLRGLHTPESKQQPNISQAKPAKSQEKSSKRKRRSVVKRALSDICEQAVVEIEEKDTQAKNSRKPFRKSLTIKSTVKSSFLQRAKLRLHTEKQKTLQYNERHLGQFSSFFHEISKNSNSYIIRPDGDWLDVDSD